MGKQDSAELELSENALSQAIWREKLRSDYFSHIAFSMWGGFCLYPAAFQAGRPRTSRYHGRTECPNSSGYTQKPLHKFWPPTLQTWEGFSVPDDGISTSLQQDAH